ncbi:TIGR00296 family protein [Candidatus Woesearchaeota archaeon]|nr:MAG: TIGR00296 family protein [Candidatus Woesearchaeota archaeon]
MELTDNDKKKLLELAKKSIESIYTKKDVDIDEYSNFSKKLGVFVTLTINGNLRGCIGYPRPVYPLYEAVHRAAMAAAFEDTRFEPLLEDEFKKTKIEISILTEPKLIEVKDYTEYEKNIELGKDGLIIEYGPNSGLLLPQVPIDWGWNKTEYLENLSNKAGLGKDAWKEPGVKIYKFQSIIFEE